MSAILLLFAGLALAVAGWAWSTRSVEGSTRVALVAVLGVTAAAFNVVVPIPSVEATTTVVLCAAAALGARTGAAAGLVAIVASSVTGGIGPWTPWQVVAVVLVALLGATLALTPPDIDWFAAAGRVRLGVTAAVATVLWDITTTVGSVLTLAPPAGVGVAEQLVTTLLLGLAFTLTHMAFTTAFTVVGGPPLLHALGRARHRLDGGIVAAAPVKA